jgi:hypothetical protein
MSEDRAQQESGEKKERARVTCENRLKGTARNKNLKQATEWRVIDTYLIVGERSHLCTCLGALAQILHPALVF